MKAITSLSCISAKYQYFLIDAWGVLHDGKTPYKGSIKCLQLLKDQNKKVIIFSNSGRRKKKTAAELLKLGIGDNLYTDIVCSGELVWHALKNRKHQALCSLGNNGYLFGSEENNEMVEGLDFKWVDSLAEANFIINTGVPAGYELTSEAVEPLIMEMMEFNLPMICANPDLEAVRAGVLGICPGSIAKRYKELGGNVVYSLGKPDKLFYQHALKLLGVQSKDKVLAIGDSFVTDIKGANNYGIDSLLIVAGIHHKDLIPLSTEGIQNFSTNYQAFPKYYCEYLN